MKFEDFVKSIDQGSKPSGLGPLLESLWLDGSGDWEGAHTLAQDDPSIAGSWVHAYLHRKEGDIGNADYWYARARRSRPRVALESEWEEIVRELLAATPT